MEILTFQIFIVLSIIVTRIFAVGYLAGVCVAWTAFTFLMVFASPLLLLQLCTIWGTYALLAEKEKGSVASEQGREEVPAKVVAQPSETGVLPATSTGKTSEPSLGAFTAFVDGIDGFSDGIKPAVKVQLATTALEMAINDERIRIDAALKRARSSIERIRRLQGLKPACSHVGMESYARAKETMTKVLPTERATIDPVLSDPCFDLPLRDPDDMIASAIEARIRDFEAERSERLAALIDVLRTDQVLRLEFAESLELFNAERTWQTIRRVANEFAEVKGKVSLIASARRSTSLLFGSMGDSFSQEVHLQLRTQTESSTVQPSQAVRPLAGLEPARADPANALNSRPLALPPSPVASPRLSESTCMSIAAEAKNRGIRNVVHFTKVENLPSIMKRGLCPVSALCDGNINYLSNDSTRFDGHRDALCLSIAHPNEKMFYKYRMGKPDQEWAVLILDPEVLSTRNVAFCRNNAADRRMRSLSLAERMTANAFSSMFASADDLPARESDRLQLYDPTDVQAEVLVFDRLPPGRIKSAAFMNTRTLRRYSEYLGDRPLSVHADRTGLFGLRSHARQPYLTF